MVMGNETLMVDCTGTPELSVTANFRCRRAIADDALRSGNRGDQSRGDPNLPGKRPERPRAKHRPPPQGGKSSHSPFLPHGQSVQERRGRPGGLGSLAGTQRGKIVVYAKADGTVLAECPPPRPPVWDGMVAAEGRLYVSLADGSIVCLAKAK